MIKRLLLPLDPSPYTANATDFAIAIAKHHKANITGLVILDIPGIEKSIGPVPLGAIHYAEQLELSKEDEAKKRISLILTEFRDKCVAADINYSEAHLQGSPSERIIAESIYYDAVIMGMKTFFHFETQDRAGDSLVKVLDQSITPIYAVPEKYKMPDLSTEIRKVLVLIDGNFSAARSLQRFAQLAIPESVEVTLLMSEDDEIFAKFNLDQAESYLQAHNFKKIEKVWTTSNVKDLLEDTYIDSTDLFVMGVHSRKGLFDFSIGSIPKYLIDLDKKPILIGL